MYQEERLKEILAMIEQQKIISVEELKAHLYVSTSTVRRDLAELSRRGLIVRSSGGAIAISEHERSDPLMLDLPDVSGTRNAASVCAARLIRPQSTVFLGASAALSGMAPLLENIKNLTVITNSSDIANALCGHSIRIYCCSGLFSEHGNAFYGSSAARFLRHFDIDYAFFTCDALTPRGMLGYSSLEQMELIQELQVVARHRVLLCGREKIGRQAPCSIQNVSGVDIVITDAPELLTSLPCEVIPVENTQ